MTATTPPRRRRPRQGLEFWLTTAALLALWELSPWLGMPVFILPPPHRILAKLLDIYPAVLVHSLITLTESVLGFLLAFLVGYPLAVGIVHSRFMERTVYPYVIAVRLVPVIAVAPLMVIWFGIGMTPKVVVSALLAFFPIVVNSVTGLRSGATEALRLMQSLKATPAQVFWKIRLYASLPYLFSALRVSATLAVIGAIVGEFVGAQKGLGNLILQYNFALDIAGVFAVLILLSVLGVALHLVMQFVQKRLIFWSEPEQVIGA